MIDPQQLMEELRKFKCVDESKVRLLCEKVKEILLEEANLQNIEAPVIVCGDIHGQFHDLLELFNQGGPIENNSYVFMGDYVDRGYYSVETLEYLLCLKLKYPRKITLLRGNHESRQITSVYGFYEEINRKYGNPNVWKYFNDTFDCMGISALIEGKIFCVHAGLSPDVVNMYDIQRIERRTETPQQGAFSDLLWSDPDDIETWSLNTRGAGWLFGSKIVEKVC